MNSIQKTQKIMVVDDEKQFLFSVELSLRGLGYKKIISISESNQVMPALFKHDIAVILLDLQMPGRSGLEMLMDIKYEYPDIPVIIVTASTEIETAIECMKKGAIDFLRKPLNANRLFSSLKTALNFTVLQQQVNSLKVGLLNKNLNDKTDFSKIITQDSKMFSLFKYIEAIAPFSDTILINGQTGTGKELMAEAIHKSSKLKGKFIAVNLAGLDDTLFSDTLFGHTKGAFTGAGNQRDGLITKAEKGTLFLDEIGDLSEVSQVKLLRLLEEGTYYPLGTDALKTSNTRLVVATNKNLNDMGKKNTFRKDLYYRLCSHQIDIPPLKKRPDDIQMLLNHFMNHAARFYKKDNASIPPELNILLANYPFPGNVRELKGMVYDAMARHTGGVLSTSAFKRAIGTSRIVSTRRSTSNAGDPIAAFENHETLPTIKEIETQLISEALRRAQGNQGIAASFLGISRQALNKRLNRQ